jgi:hypothetical protein
MKKRLHTEKPKKGEHGGTLKGDGVSKKYGESKR